MASGGTQPAGFGFQCLNFQVDKLKKNQNPGVAPPDGAILFYWPKRVCRKGPALRWACLARQGGSLNSGFSCRTKGQRFPRRTRGSCEPLLFWKTAEVVMFVSFSLASHTERSGPLTQGRIPITAGPRRHGNPAKEMPSARRKALLHTFVAGQKYGVWRDATRRFCFYDL